MHKEKPNLKELLYNWKTLLSSGLLFFALYFVVIPTVYPGGVSVTCSTSVKTGEYICDSILPPWYVFFLACYFVVFAIMVYLSSRQNKGETLPNSQRKD